MISRRLAGIFLLLTILPLANSFAMNEELTLEDSLNFLKSRLPEKFPENATIEIFSKISGISFYVKEIEDEDFKFLAPLCKLDNIKTLNFQCHKLTGGGLKELFIRCGEWNSVTRLDLGSNPLMEEYLEFLIVFPNLESLNIDFHQENGPKSLVDGTFLKKIKLEKLKMLHAKRINITEENALELLDWQALECFTFGSVNLSESCLSNLRKEKIDLDFRFWDLRRLQWEITNGPRLGSSFDAEFRMSTLNRALNIGLLSEQAFRWALENNVGISIFEDAENGYPPQIFGTYIGEKSGSQL